MEKKEPTLEDIKKKLDKHEKCGRCGSDQVKVSSDGSVKCGECDWEWK